jgi:acyl-CoA synthetase (AMP-forming)/AMP-acid ligase II
VVAIDAPDGSTHVPDASGRPLPHLRVRIAGEGGEDLPAGETGEVRVAPAPGDDRYRLMLGYWQRPDATAEVLAGGELHTGDLGFLDDAGNLHIRDRKSLLIIRGGANVYPAEVERVLLDAPGVAACAVFGVPDDRLGERVVAVVELAAGVAELDEVAVRDHCLANLARYKVPERFVVVDSIPRNAMGKVARIELPGLL